MEMEEIEPCIPKAETSQVSDDHHGTGNQEGSLDEQDGWSFHTTKPDFTLSDLMADYYADDAFQAEVAQKTRTYLLVRQEAEMEALIDRLVRLQGTKNDALLFVVSDESIPEVKMQMMVNTLIHRGADPSCCDPEGMTPLHHATQRGIKGVVRKLLDHDAQTTTARDRQQRLPLKIATENNSDNSDDIAALLLVFMPNEIVRSLFLSKGDRAAEFILQNLIESGMKKTVLAVLDCMIDPIGQSGHVRIHYHVLEADEHGRPPYHKDFKSGTRSCLHHISKGGYKKLAYHNVVRMLVRRKWKQFARFQFLCNSILFLLTQLALCFSAVSATMTSDPTVYTGGLHIARAVFEVWSVMFVAVSFCLELNQIRKHHWDYFTDRFNWLDLTSTSLLLTTVALRWTHRTEQWPVFSVGYLLWTLRIFKYAAVFRQSGAYSQILWRIVTSDFPQFLTVFAAIMLAFSGAFLLVLRGEDALHVHPETSTYWDILFTGVRILIEGAPVVEYTGPNGYKPMSCILMVLFLFTCCVVLLNILIAQLSDTYQNVQRDAQRGLELNRAWIVARVELNSLFDYAVRGRLSQNLEEVIIDPTEVLGKWKTPPLNEINKQVQDVWDSLESHTLNLLTIKKRISRQEYALCKIQGQMDKVVDMMTQLTTAPSSVSRKNSDLTSLPEEGVPHNIHDVGATPKLE